jgi:LysR family hydrogen peroxide-inducible transcriptional activator
MNIRDIEYIIAVAEQGSFSGAAVRCHVSQPSLSAQIKKVEDQLGLKIFERTKRSVRLSLYGESFISHARRILSEVERMKSEAREQINPFTGSVSLGAIANRGPIFLPAYFASFKKTGTTSEYYAQGKRNGNIAQGFAGRKNRYSTAEPADRRQRL